MNCLSCGPTSAKASGEHIFSAWLLREFDPKAAGALYRPQDNGGLSQVRPEILLDNFRLKQICEQCNNGWMSALERRTMPIILDVTRNGRTLGSLEEPERRILAKWAAKTAIIESYAVSAECPINREYLRVIRDNPDNHPGNFAVLGSRITLEAFMHAQISGVRDLEGGGKVARSTIVIIIPNLAFVCAFPMFPGQQWTCSYVPAFAGPLWPPASCWQTMETDESTLIEGPDLQEKLLTAMARSIRLEH